MVCVHKIMMSQIEKWGQFPGRRKWPSGEGSPQRQPWMTCRLCDPELATSFSCKLWSKFFLLQNLTLNAGSLRMKSMHHCFTNYSMLWTHPRASAPNCISPAQYPGPPATWQRPYISRIKPVMFVLETEITSGIYNEKWLSLIRFFSFVNSKWLYGSRKSKLSKGLDLGEKAWRFIFNHSFN